MTQIRSLFDPDKGIHRSIEKVISYQASQEERLKAEIRGTASLSQRDTRDALTRARAGKTTAIA